MLKTGNLFFWNNKEKFYQTYEISTKNLIINYITPFTYKQQRPIGFHRSAQPPQYKADVYLSIFCPVSEKEIQLLSFKNNYEQTTTVHYGWTMFCISTQYYCLDLSQLTICTTNQPETKNDIKLVSCNKPNFKMYILHNNNNNNNNNNKVPMALLSKSKFIKFVSK